MLLDIYVWLLDQGPQLLIAALLFAGSVILFRRMRCWPTGLQLVGAGSYFAYTLLWGFLAYMAPYALTHPESKFARAIYPTDTEAQAFNYAYMVLKIIAVCFPVGFLWSMLRIRKNLT